MDQFVLFNFSTVINSRVYRVVVQPGSPWEDIEEAIEQFKVGFKDLKEEAKKKEEEAAGNGSQQNDKTN